MIINTPNNVNGAYTQKFYHEVCADIIGASKLDTKQEKLKEKILEAVL